MAGAVLAMAASIGMAAPPGNPAAAPPGFGAQDNALVIKGDKKATGARIQVSGIVGGVPIVIDSGQFGHRGEIMIIRHDLEAIPTQGAAPPTYSAGDHGSGSAIYFYIDARANAGLMAENSPATPPPDVYRGHTMITAINTGLVGADFGNSG